MGKTEYSSMENNESRRREVKPPAAAYTPWTSAKVDKVRLRGNWIEPGSTAIKPKAEPPPKKELKPSPA
jgi:hypothetical protein